MAESGKQFILEIVTPAKQVLSAQVDEAVIPGEDGYFGVLAGHEPFIATLKSGILMYRQEDRKRFAAVHGGFAEVLPDKVLVAADNAELSEEIDIERAQAALERARERLKKPTKDTDLDRAGASVMRAVTRLSVASHVATRSAQGR
jgi:F-type H+-transporting ATPase subunit epsilon